MKRISCVATVFLAVMPTVTNAYHYGFSHYSSLRYRARYSPYAFSYRHPSGLIPGGLRYSPYTSGLAASNLRYSPYASGLVPYGVRYSPYAFSHGHSGLICDYSFSGFSCPPYLIVGSTGCCPTGADYKRRKCGRTVSHRYSGSADSMRRIREVKLRARKERLERLREAAEEIEETRENDGKEIIYSYLKSKNLDFRMNRLLRIESKTLSAEFLLKDKDLIIKYWNPDEIEQQEGYREGICEEYHEKWRDLSQEFVANGGKTYEINSGNKEEILSKLDLCSQLHDG